MKCQQNHITNTQCVNEKQIFLMYLSKQNKWQQQEMYKPQENIIKIIINTNDIINKLKLLQSDCRSSPFLMLPWTSFHRTGASKRMGLNGRQGSNTELLLSAPQVHFALSWG